MAFVAKSLGRLDRALEHYRHAYQYAPDDRPTLAALAAVLFQREDWQGAADAYQELVAQGRGAGDALEREGLLKLGHCAVKLRDRGRAVDAFERVLERDPENDRALRALAELQAAGDDWTAVVRSKLALLPTAGEEDRYQIYREIAEIYWNRLAQPAQAEACYRRALEERPEGREALQDLLELYSAGERWEETIEICETIAGLEQRPAYRAKYWFAAAVICRRKLQDADRAVVYLNRTLEADPERLEAFEAIDRILTDRRDWKKLQHNYGKMLKRLAADGPRELRVMLWQNLGEILRSRRRDLEGAIAAFEAAQSLDPDNEGRCKILAELYVTCGAAYRGKAIAAYHELVRRWPSNIEAYQALRRLYSEAENLDRAWCLSAALSYVRRADEEERHLFRKHRRREMVLARGQVTDDLWRGHLLHETQDPRLGALLASLAPVVAGLSARAHARFGLKRKDRYDPASGRDPFYEIFSYATLVLNVVEADLFLRPGEQVGMLLAHTSGGPSLVVGAELLGKNARQVYFVVGRQLTFLRPEHFLRGVLAAPSQLLAVLLAARALFEQDLPIPEGLRSRVDQLRAQLRRRLQAAQLEQLRSMLEALGPVGQVELLRWWNATELTAERVGFLLCNDLAAAAEVVGGATVVGGTPPRERIRQLVQYAVSRPYLELRERIGLTIDAG
jgi:tetratricopeptide (TPR) repeat protein